RVRRARPARRGAAGRRRRALWSRRRASRRRRARTMAVRSSGERRAEAANGTRLGVERGNDGEGVVRLAGSWALEDGLPDAAGVEEVRGGSAPPPAVAFDMSKLERWDSGVLAFVAKVEDVARDHKVRVNRTGLPPAVQQLLALAESAREEQGARAPDRGAS